MNNDNGSDLLVAVFIISTQLGGIGTKAQDLVTSFQITESE